MRRDNANGIIETGLIAGVVAVLVFAASAGIKDNCQKWAGLSGVNIADSAGGSTGAKGLTKSSTGTSLGSASKSSSKISASSSAVNIPAGSVETSGSMGGVGASTAMVAAPEVKVKPVPTLEPASAEPEDASPWDKIVADMTALGSSVATSFGQAVEAAVAPIVDSGWMGNAIKAARSAGVSVGTAVETAGALAADIGRKFVGFLGL
jgi:hypothetical protein